MKRKFIIVDPSLKDERGHHYALTKAIAQGAADSGLDVIVFANKSISSLSKSLGLKVRGVFSSSMYDSFIKVKSKPVSKFNVTMASKTPKLLLPALISFKKKICGYLNRGKAKVKGVPGSDLPKRLSEELLEAILEEELCQHDCILVHTADGEIYRAVLELAMHPKFESFPSFHLCTPYDANVMPHFKKGISVDRVIDYLDLLGVLGSKVLLYAENSLLAEHLGHEWGVHVRTLEIPAPILPAATDLHDYLHVVYLGAAREEKGFHLLPDVVQQILERGVATSSIRFTLQCSPQIIGYLPVIERALEKLREYPKKFVKLIEQQQSMDDYYALLQRADVILLCYDHDKYRVRGSGIAVEAVASGKVIIATPDTFPAELAGKGGLTATTSTEVAEAIVAVSENKQHYIAMAKARKLGYINAHHPEMYVSLILESCNISHKQGRVSAECASSNGELGICFPKLVNGYDYTPDFFI